MVTNPQTFVLLNGQTLLCNTERLVTTCSKRQGTLQPKSTKEQHCRVLCLRLQQSACVFTVCLQMFHWFTCADKSIRGVLQAKRGQLSRTTMMCHVDTAAWHSYIRHPDWARISCECWVKDKKCCICGNAKENSAPNNSRYVV